MATDKWNGNGDWTGNPGDWSNGEPGPSTSAEIQSGTATLTTSASVATLLIDPGATLAFGNDASLVVTSWIKNSGTLLIGDNADGEHVSIGGTLDNSGFVDIGYTGLAASTSVTAAGLSNSGTLILQGNASSGTANQATLDMTGAVPTTVTGTLRVLGDADLELATKLTSVGNGGFLQVDGAQARISLGAGATSTALASLSLNDGTTNFDGNCALGAGGTSITTTVGFTNVGTLLVDYYGGDGATSVSFGGTLTNEGSAYIGNTTLGGNAAPNASTSVTATGFANSGTLVLQGNASTGATNEAVLDITGTSPASVTGTLRVLGDADLELKTGITSVAYGGFFQVDGAQARVSLGAGTASSALTGLSVNDGLTNFDGNCALGGGGTSITTTTSFTNAGTLWVDYYNNDGATSVSVGGTLDNEGTAIIGNTALGGNAAANASTSVTATGFANSGTLVLQGNASTGATNEAVLDITGTSPASVTGTLRVLGDADLELKTGITAIGYGGFFQVDGAQARVSLGAGASSMALTGLSQNDGLANFDGNCSLGGGGTSITTTTSFTNVGTLWVDYYGSDGATSVSFGGTLTNAGTAIIGNTSLGGNAAPGASTTVTAKALVNSGSLVLQGNNASGATNEAVLDITGTTSTSLSGDMRIGGDADLAVGTDITSIAVGSELELDGAQARLSLGLGTTNSALNDLSSNAGTFLLRGNSNLGAGAPSITTAKPFTNAGLMQVDYYGFDGGTTLTIGGALTVEGPLYIGNSELSAATTVTADALSNHGSIILQGNNAAGATDQATLDITGGSGSTVNGWIRVGGDADFAVGTAIGTIAVGSSLEVDGALARVSLGTGSTGSALTGLLVNDGTFLIRGNSPFGAGGTSITTAHNFANGGTLLVDYYGFDGGSTLSVAGALTNDAYVDVGNGQLSATTTLTASSLSNNGSFILQGNSGSGATSEAIVDVTGAFSSPASGYTRVGGDADLAVGSAITIVAAGSQLEVDGAQARISLGVGTSNSALTDLIANDGTLYFRGDSGFGAGGTSITTTANFANAGNLSIDLYGFDGGSRISFGGVLTNDGSITIGNGELTAATTLTAAGLANDGSIALLGGNGNLAEFVINGGATNTGNISIFGSAELDVTGTHVFVQDSGSTIVSGTFIANVIEVEGGVVDFTSAVAAGDGAATFDIGPVGTLAFGGAVSSTHAVDFTAATGTLALGVQASLAGTISGFSGSDVIDLQNVTVTGLSYSGSATSGTLSVTESSGAVVTLAFKGNYTTASFGTSSDGQGGTDIIDPPRGARFIGSVDASGRSVTAGIAAGDHSAIADATPDMATWLDMAPAGLDRAVTLGTQEVYGTGALHDAVSLRAYWVAEILTPHH